MKKNESVSYIFKYAKQEKFKILIINFLELILGVSPLLSAIGIKNIVHFAFENRNREELILWLIIESLIIILNLFFRQLETFLKDITKVKVSNNFKRNYIDKLLKKEYKEVITKHSQDYINRCLSDADIISESSVSLIPDIIGVVTKLGAAFIYIMVIEYRVIFVALPVGIIVVLLSTLLRKKLKSLHKDIQESQSKLKIFLSDRLTNFLLLRTYNKENETISDLDLKLNDYKSKKLKSSIFTESALFCFALFLRIFYICAFIYGVFRPYATVSSLSAILEVTTSIFGPLSTMGGFLPRFYNAIASAERMLEINDINDDRTDVLDNTEINKIYQKMDSIELQNASFKFDTDKGIKEVLNNYNLKIKKNEITALVGESGKGKSTILSILLGLYQLDSGSVKINYNDNTTDELTSKYRKLFAYVPQTNLLFTGTIREILSFDDKNLINDDNKLYESLKMVSLYDHVVKLEKGLDTRIGELGQGLSTGEFERLSIARGLLLDRPILLLDEVTASLDEITEEKVINNLKKINNKTIVLITHRKRPLEIASNIIDLDKM